MTPDKKHTMLCLGDSYTIGEAVEESERFPMQAVAMLEKENIHFDKPVIIAKTGWTTDELTAAIQEQNPSGTYDVVTLLIGVNNQYRGRDLENYRQEFVELLHTALNYAGKKTKHVYVVSIPDWGVTPFGHNDKRGEEQIGKEIDQYNVINKEEARKAGVNYIDITPGSRKAKTDADLIANDGLHPSGKMYKVWAEKLVAAIGNIF
ncbi:MAG TPA: SGNH/GDSL hydrolase family protein [Chitinophagales bacterium]|nr:SGNH/GDSL hydrolase family protein [Chitinophagales bacterium]